MDRRLGEPLPHQLSNPTRAHPCAINLWQQKHAIPLRYAVLSSVSRCYPPHKGRLLTRYSPVRHWSAPKGFTVRLECVMHAASVHPEPGSNSRTNCISTPLGVETFISPSALALTLLFRVWSMLVKASTLFFLGIFEKFALALLVLISPVVQLSMINILATLLRSLNSISHRSRFVNRFSKSFFKFFQLFSKPLSKSLIADSFHILSLSPLLVNPFS